MQERIDQDAPRVLSVVWNLIRGGTEGQCARVAMGLAGEGAVHRVAVFRCEGFFLEAVESACGPVYEIGIQRMFSLDTWRRIQELARFIREEQFDLVHLWDIDAVIFGSIAARQAGVPYLTSRRDMGSIYPWHKLAMMKRADQQARGIVVNAEAIADLVGPLGIKTPVRVMPNMLDLLEFDRLAEAELDLGVDEGPLFGMVCRLDPEKDVATFLKGVSMAVERHPEIRVVIAGDGVERQALEALSAKLGLGGQVRFLGEFHEVPALVKRLFAGVLVPASNEGLSNTILEYMAGSKAVIASDCGGNRELVKDGQTGVLVPSGDPEKLAEALVALLADPEQAAQLGQNGRAYIEARHAPMAVIAAFQSYYQDVWKG